jgi:phosphoglycolate phosphatase
MAAAQTALIFDLDGTLTDPREGITRCYLHALERLGRSAPQFHDRYDHIGPPLREVLAQLLATDQPELIEQGVTFYRERFGTIGLFENEPYAGIDGVLAGLRAAGHRLFVCTSKAHVYARRILSHFELAQYFEAIYGSELDGRFGDKAELLGHLLAQERIAPDAAVMIGDRLHDIRAARMNHTRSLGVLYGFGDRAELTEAGADALCQSVGDLASALGVLSALPR